eukprot:GILJ01014505.1.p1 GENE.GILJ01014505.1~~GILJ01014505.1.p1  ORF type:complete len:1557 (+),score=304.04 GILJ01014505.1:174-4673(+)
MEVSLLVHALTWCLQRLSMTAELETMCAQLVQACLFVLRRTVDPKMQSQVCKFTAFVACEKCVSELPPLIENSLRSMQEAISGLDHLLDAPLYLNGNETTAMPLSSASMLAVQLLTQDNRDSPLLIQFGVDVLTLCWGLLTSRHDPLRTVASKTLLPTLLLNFADNTVWLKLWNVITSLSVQSSNHATEAYGLMCQYWEQLYTLQKITDMPKFWELTQTAMSAEDPLARKRGLHLLKQSVAHIIKDRNLPQNVSQELYESSWLVFFDLYENMDHFGGHLVKSVWPRLSELWSLCLNAPTSSLPVPSMVTPSWLHVLFQRAFVHPNDSVTKFILLDLLDRGIPPFESGFITGPLLIHLTIPQWYRDAETFESRSEFGEKLCVFWKTYLDSLSGQHRDEVLRAVVATCGQHCKFIVPSRYMLQALSEVNGSQAWGKTALESIRKWIKQSMYSHAPSLRPQLYQYLIQALIRHVDLNRTGAVEIVQTLAMLPPQFVAESSRRQSLVEWLSKPSIAKLGEYVESTLNQWLKLSTAGSEVKSDRVSWTQLEEEAEQWARGFFLLSDLTVQNRCCNVLWDALDLIYTHTYLPVNTQEKRLLLLTSLLRELVPFSTPPLLKLFKDGVMSCISEINSYLESRIVFLSGDYAQLSSLLRGATIYLDVIKTLTLFSDLSTVRDLVQKLTVRAVATVERISELPTTAHTWETSLCLCLSLRLLQITVDSVQVSTLSAELMELIVSMTVLKPQRSLQDDFGSEVDSVGDLNWSQLVDQITSFKWDTVRKMLNRISVGSIPSSIQETMLSSCLNALDSATEHMKRPVLVCLRRLLLPTLVPKLKSRDESALNQLKDVLAIALSCMKEGGNRADPAVVVEFAALAFNKSLFSDELAWLHDSAINNGGYLRNLFIELIQYGEEAWLVTRCVVQQCVKVWTTDPSCTKFYRDPIIDLLLFQEPRGKDADRVLSELKVEEVAIVGIETDPIEGDLNQVVNKEVDLTKLSAGGAFVRASVMMFLDSLDPNQNRYHRELLDDLIVSLLNLNLTREFQKNYMPMSTTHRRKIRCWQSLCVLSKFFYPGLVKKINDRIWKILLVLNLSTVRHYMELFAMRFMLQYPEPMVYKAFLEPLSDVNLRPPVAISFVEIAGYVVLNLEVNQHVNFVKSVFPSLFVYCLSHTAALRSLAHYIIYNLMTTQKADLIKVLQNQVGIADPSAAGQPPTTIFGSMLHYLETNKDCTRMRRCQAPFFEKFDPISDCGLNRVLSTPLDESGELIPVPFLDEVREAIHYGMCDVRADVPPEATYGQLKTGISEEDEEGEEEPLSISSFNYQRKIMPWNSLEHENETNRDLHRNRDRFELIIIASLLDRIPNLAGLTRTCEIFNASKLIIPNIRLLEDPRYKNISVTAEKWLPVEEVKEEDLMRYLKRQKEEGYAMLGLEQTANSKDLCTYQFPKKAVLLLGREREGIPVEFIQMLDDCIEIPQLGMVRSLNVHVSGAICIWEYTRQRLLQKQT